VLFKAAEFLPRLPHFDARFTVASCGPNSSTGRMFFAAGDQNSKQLNLLFEVFNVHGLILHKLDHEPKNSSRPGHGLSFSSATNNRFI
jgi:hypothetical protein